MTPYEAKHAELERHAAVARAAALTAERFGYLVAVLAAVACAAVGGWIVSLPLAIAGYILTVRPYHKAVEKADTDLLRHEDSAPATGY